jgi:biotin carboxyl carrier protein
MKLSVRIGGEEVALELARTPQGWRFQAGGGPPREAQVTQPEPGIYSVLIAGRSYEARIEEGAVAIDGHRIEVEVRDPRQFRRGAAAHGAEGLASVTAPIPGKVIRLLVEPGAQVTSGQPLMVIEAMKMQNEMRAPRSGRVASIPVREGETVAAGEVLATIG